MTQKKAVMQKKPTGSAARSAGQIGAALLAGLAVLFVQLMTIADPASAQNPNVRPPSGATTQAVPPPPSALSKTPEMSRFELWEKLRRGEPGTTVAASPNASVLVQAEGEEWRDLRNSTVMVWGGRVLLGVLSLLALYYLVRGRIRIEGGRTGRVIPRFSLTERVVHWLVAGLWLILAISGLLILFGRHVVLPVFGPAVFSAIASASLQAHNLLGPVFAVSTLLLFFTFARGNFLSLVDIKWLFKGGGFFGGHASSHRYNFGEKTWFWVAVILGIVLSVSGFALLFPQYAGPPAVLQLANIAHAVAAIGFMAFGFGHIYLATIGMEGALEGMTRGTVDENWAKEHHDLWWEDHKHEARTDHRSAEADAALGRV